MTEDSKVHPAPAPVTMGKTKTGLWKKCLGFAGILLVVLFVGGMVGMTQFMTLEDTRIKDIGSSDTHLKTYATYHSLKTPLLVRLYGV